MADFGIKGLEQLRGSEFLNKGERGYIIPLPVSENEIANCITKIINNKEEGTVVAISLPTLNEK